MSDEYVRVRGTVQKLSKSAVLFAVGKSVPRAAWVPRSCLHGADDLKLESTLLGEELTLRIREWKADEVGFTGNPDGETRDMFRGQQ